MTISDQSDLPVSDPGSKSTPTQEGISNCQNLCNGNFFSNLSHYFRRDNKNFRLKSTNSKKELQGTLFVHLRQILFEFSLRFGFPVVDAAVSIFL